MSDSFIDVLRPTMRRLLNSREARDYIRTNPESLGIRPVVLPNGRKYYDVRALDKWIDDYWKEPEESPDDWIGRLG